MSDDKKQQGSGENSSSSSSNDSGNTGNTDPSNEIPFVPPTDRTNLNESVDFDIKPFTPPTTETSDE